MKVIDVFLDPKIIITTALMIYGIGASSSFVSALPADNTAYDSTQQKPDLQEKLNHALPNIPFVYSSRQAVRSSRQMACIETGSIKSYHIHDDATVEFHLKQNRRVFVKVQSCQDLFFHQYAGFIPTNGQLCISRDSLITREGYSCPIQDMFITKTRPGTR